MHFLKIQKIQKITTFMLHILSLEAMKNRLKFKLMFTENLSIMAVVTIVFKSMDLLPTYCIPLKNERHGYMANLVLLLGTPV